MTLAREGLREMLLATCTLGVAGAASAWAAAVSSAWFSPLAVGLLVLWAMALLFFRDPARAIPPGDDLLVSPADGRITEISRLERYDGIDGPAIRIGIFLSVFDVHVNRTPCAGRVLSTDYRPGEFLDARHPECGLRNEANTIFIEPAGELRGPIIVRQIAGLIARRIVCHLKVGDCVQAGQRFGLIKFGSRTELIVPADAGLEVKVRIDDHVSGGSSVLMARSGKPSRDEDSQHRPAAHAERAAAGTKGR